MTFFEFLMKSSRVISLLMKYPKVILFASLPIAIAILLVFVPANTVMQAITVFNVFVLLFILMGAYVSLLIAYGKATDNALKAARAWREYSRVLKILYRDTQTLHETLTSVIRLNEHSPHTIIDDIPSEESTESDYESEPRPTKETESNVENWELPPGITTNSNHGSNSVSVS